MDAPGWLSRHRAEVPAGSEWLGPNERRVFSELRTEPRRASWRLGRWTAKAAIGAFHGVAPAEVQVLAASDGAPEAWVGNRQLPLSLSLSHRGGRAVAAVSEAPRTVGCDLELVEPRSGAFVREWLSASEQRLIAGQPDDARALLVNLIWSAKEAAAKIRREGLRLDVRRAEVTTEDPGGEDEGWRPLAVCWDDNHGLTRGWWRILDEWVLVIAAEPAPTVPRELVPSEPTMWTTT